MPRNSKRLLLWTTALIPVIAIAIATASGWREASIAADQSAHAALTKEIVDQLDATPNGEPYPTSLSQLRVTYPDGGNASLLERFEYHSDGKTYELRTQIRNEEIIKRGRPRE